MRKAIFLLLLFTLYTKANAQEIEEPSPIKWYSIEEAQKLAKKQPRPLFVDVYTDWCGWCKHMMKTTFANKDLAGYIQNNFYPVRYDAETKDTIVYNGKQYVNSDFLASEKERLAAEKAGKPYKPLRKKFTHDLAKEILGGRLSYPTIVYVDKTGKANPVPGYMDVNKIQPFLVYFAEEIHGNTSFEDFNALYYFSFPKSFEKEIKEMKGAKPDTSGVVKWYSFNEAQTLNAKEPRMFYIDLHANYKTSCRVMEQTTYKDSAVAKILNEKYYPIRFDAMSKEEVAFFGQKLINEGKKHPFHQLAVNFAVDRKIGQILFPTLVFLGSDKKMITKIQSYMPPKLAAPFLQFISDGSYKTKKWPEYLKAYSKK